MALWTNAAVIAAIKPFYIREPWEIISRQYIGIRTRDLNNWALNSHIRVQVIFIEPSPLVWGESSVAHSTSTTRDRVLGSARGLRFIDLSLTPSVFLRILKFSTLCKFDFHAKIWAVERLNFSLWLGRIGNHFFRNWN